MIGSRGLPIMACALATVLACAARTDDGTRAAFEAAAKPTTRKGPDRPDRPGSRPPRRPSAPKSGWQATAELLDAAIALIGSGVDAPQFIAVATRWCAVAPEAKTNQRGLTYVCFPREALEVGERSFVLEVVSDGTVSVYMDELDDATSGAVVEQARVALARLCATPFAAAPTQEPTQRLFHTCPVDGGSTLAVGRARASTTTGWFVTAAVLGALRPTGMP